MSDLIDRQALLKQIDIDSDGEPGYYGDTWKFIDTIKNMPNVHDLPKDTDTISRAKAIDAINHELRCGAVIDQCGLETAHDLIEELPPAQPEIVRCKDCKYWNSGSCEYPEHAVNCQDYWVGDIETEAEHFCGYAKRREVTE